MLLAIPTFYVLIRALVQEEVDEELIVEKVAVVKKLQEKMTKNPGVIPDLLDNDLIIIKAAKFIAHDSFYNETIYDTTLRERIPHRVLVTHQLLNNKPYEILIRVSMLDYDNLIEVIVAVQAFVMVLLFIGLQVINRKLSKRIWDPFYRTLHQLRRYRVEEQQALLFDKTGYLEFDDLNKAITQLTERNHKAYVSQKEFVENASHELQTPLTIFQTKLELLMQTSPLNSEQAGLISSMADTSQRMNRMNKALLLLSKIDNQLYSGKEEIDLKQLFNETVTQFEDAIEQKNLKVQVGNHSRPKVEANRTLLEILANNLVFNAIRHNMAGGIVEVSFNDHEVAIENTGSAKPLDPDQIFQRFKKQSSDANSLGLGLEIISKICRINEFGLRYRFHDNKHCFIIDLQGGNGKNSE
ncbi:hypothetical protein OI18_13490 [Flavihumibacter solisilvae]|uniref:histidine kinase n=2 Tax=Flavihumibacter solisilvae TaxID=1349421 RepID=A0A0C1L226_9BACT|nr:hypothetical protein OI18_13490 [Flavihumibacter solisilvae]